MAGAAAVARSLSQHVHFALRHEPPVLKPVSPEKAEKIEERIDHACNAAQQKLKDAQDHSNNAQGSWWLHPVTHFSPALTVFFALGIIGFNIARNEGYIDVPSEGLPSGCTDGELATLGTVVGGAIQAATIYWGNNKQTGVVGEATTREARLAAIVENLGFLKESLNMSKDCLKNNPPANLKYSFPSFMDRVKQKHKNTLPDLFAAWHHVDEVIKAAGNVPAADPAAPAGQAPANVPAADPANAAAGNVLANVPAADPAVPAGQAPANVPAADPANAPAGGHVLANVPAANPANAVADDQLREYIRHKINPLIRHYAKETIILFKELGYISAEVPQVVVHGAAQEAAPGA